jgi:hypothetical protein
MLFALSPYLISHFAAQRIGKWRLLVRCNNDGGAQVRHVECHARSQDLPPRFE